MTGLTSSSRYTLLRTCVCSQSVIPWQWDILCGLSVPECEKSLWRHCALTITSRGLQLNPGHDWEDNKLNYEIISWLHHVKSSLIDNRVEVHLRVRAHAAYCAFVSVCATAFAKFFFPCPILCWSSWVKLYLWKALRRKAVLAWLCVSLSPPQTGWRTVG